MLLKRLKLIDKWVLIPYLILTCFSIIMVYSASSYSALQDYGNAEHYLIRQAIFVVSGIILASFTSIFPLKHLKNKKVIMAAMFITCVLLIYLLLFGDAIYGARRWIPTPFFNIQPAEIAKLVAVWYLAYILSRRQHIISKSFLKSIVAPCLLVGFMMFLIFLQPDTGTTIIILAVVTVMILASGISPKFAFSFGGLGVAGITGVLFLIRVFGESLPFMSGYRYDRFQAFWDPFALSTSHGLQLVNSYYALANGGLLGVGLGNSVQKTGYLPFPYTDFIMAVLGEELGLVGILVVLILFTTIIARTYLIGVRSKNSFRSILCIGIATLLLVQGFINLGGVVGLIPITGLTFPFLSYGGSSMMISSIAIGLVLNISIRDNLEKEEQEKVENN